MVATGAQPEHDGVRIKEVDMQASLSLWVSGLAARLPKDWAPSLSQLFRRLRLFHGWPVQACQRSAPADSSQAQRPEDDGTWGCGWFDSSHELVHGLQVQEDSAEALNALPLATWLDLQLRLCSPSAPAA
jgi:hypothetical protein